MENIKDVTEETFIRIAHQQKIETAALIKAAEQIVSIYLESVPPLTGLPAYSPLAILAAKTQYFADLLIKAINDGSAEGPNKLSGEVAGNLSKECFPLYVEMHLAIFHNDMPRATTASEAIEEINTRYAAALGDPDVARARELAQRTVKNMGVE